MSKKRKTKGAGCALGFILSLLVALINVLTAILLGVVRAVTSLLRWLHSQKTTLPIGSGISTSWLVITIGLALSCFGCFAAYATTNAALRQMGVLPTYTPPPTNTLTATPIPTETRTNTPRPTNTFTPTRQRPTATRLPPTATRVPPTATASRLQVIPINTNTSEPVIVAPTNPPAPTQEPAPTQPPAASATVLEFRSPVPTNGNARVVIQTTAGAQCFLSYYTPSGRVSEAAGLGATTADGNGICAWEWKIGSNTNPGTGSVSIAVNGIQVITLPIVIE